MLHALTTTDATARPRFAAVTPLFAPVGRRGAVAAMLLWAALAATAAAQVIHYRDSAMLPPGELGQRQLTRGGPLPGYFQPVEIVAPAAVRVALAAEGAFLPPQPTPVTAGMLIGQVYRLRVTQIPLHEGREVFPTIEVIHRLYPPAGEKTRFPIPIHLTHEELVMALEGKFVTRVIYLEDPRSALPLPENPRFQRFFEVGRDDDPLRVADELGRPMAILRMGSRIPGPQGPDAAFLYGSPPIVVYPNPQAAALPPGPQLDAAEGAVAMPLGSPRAAAAPQGQLPILPGLRRSN